MEKCRHGLILDASAIQFGIVAGGVTGGIGGFSLPAYHESCETPSAIPNEPHAPGRLRRAAGQEDASKTSKKAFTAGAWEEARALIWTHRKRLALGLGLMLVNRLAGLVLPTTTKYLMDDVIAQEHWDLLPTLALAAGAATLVDAVDRRSRTRRCSASPRSARSPRCARTSRRT